MSAIPSFTTDGSATGNTTQQKSLKSQSPDSVSSDLESLKRNSGELATLCAPERGQPPSFSDELLLPSLQSGKPNEKDGDRDAILLPKGLQIINPKAPSVTPSSSRNDRPRSEGLEDAAGSPTLVTVFNRDCDSEISRSQKRSTEKHNLAKSFLESMDELWNRSGGDDTFQDPSSSYSDPIIQSFNLESQEHSTALLCEWLRVAEWWALKGSTGLKNITDQHPSAPALLPHHKLTDQLQGACDMKKAQWICYHVFPSHAEIAQIRKIGLDGICTVDLAILELYSDVLQRYRSIMVIMRSLDSVMACIQWDIVDRIMDSGIDLRLFLPYPSLSREHESLVYNTNGTPSTICPGGSGILPTIVTTDTAQVFHYNNSFLETRVWTKEGVPSPSFACVLSIVRERSSSQGKWILASQTQLVHLVIHSHGNDVITWKDVRWDVDQKCMWISIAKGVQISAEFTEESDFRRHWSAASNINDFTSRIGPRVHETLLFESELEFAHHKNYSTPTEFPASPVERCIVRLFEQKEVNGGSPKAIQAPIFRMVLSTPCSMKHTSSISLFLGRRGPLLYNVFESAEGFSSILLDISNEDQGSTVLLCFDTSGKRDTFHACLTGLSSHHIEAKKTSFTVRSFSVSELQGTGEAGLCKRLDFGKGSITIIRPLLTHSVNYDQTRNYECLKIVNLTEQGSFADRVFGDLGNLRIGLEVMETNLVSVFRKEQSHVLATVAIDQANQYARHTMEELENLMSRSPSSHKLEFTSKKDLHGFIESISGYEVTFDGLVNDFIFIRPRKRVPLATQKWHAGLTRVQVLRRNKSFQLCVLFNNFRHGRSMIFPMKSTDEIEFFEDKVGYALRIIDAKYPMPDKDMNGICLASPQYPAQHGDLVIMFTESSARNAFASYLPAFAREYYS